MPSSPEARHLASFFIWKKSRSFFYEKVVQNAGILFLLANEMIMTNLVSLEGSEQFIIGLQKSRAGQ